MGQHIYKEALDSCDDDDDTKAINLKFNKSEDVQKAEDGQMNVERNSPEREDRDRNILDGPGRGQTTHIHRSEASTAHIPGDKVPGIHIITSNKHLQQWGMILVAQRCD